MAKTSGRRGRLYAGLASDTALASPVASLNKWSLSGASDQMDATVFGDTGKTYVAGLPDTKGTYAGLLDGGTDQLFAASQDGLARKTYLYPDTNSVGTYWFGTAFFDHSVDIDVGSVNTCNGSFAAATPFAKVG